MKFLKAFKYRLRPNREQKVLFAQFSGCCRFVYNKGLERRIEVYEKEHRTLGYYDQNKELIFWKTELPWLTECHSQILQQTLKDLMLSSISLDDLKIKRLPVFLDLKEKELKTASAIPKDLNSKKTKSIFPR